MPMNQTNDSFDDTPFSGMLSVTELTGIVKKLIENNLPTIAVYGEVSNYTPHSSGHHYFTLKDEMCQLKCVLFRWQAERVDFTVNNGMMVKAVGNVTVYERGGQYQLNVIRLLPLGRGELLARLEELKKKLAQEGLFERKRPLPLYPSTVAVVTSPTGAAIRDIISIIRRRAPHVRIILRETRVQGEGAAEDIAMGIEEINRFTDADVMIVGRGGGSVEDLWCFNEEIVARAIVSSGIPVISAVGHETDVTLADFAAALRAPTPSAAAELVVKDSQEILQTLSNYQRLIRQRMLSILDEMTRTVHYLSKQMSPERLITGISLKSQSVDELSMRMKNACVIRISEREKTIENLGGRLSALNPAAVLERGYSIVYRDSDARVLTNSAMVEVNDTITVKLAQGCLGAVIKNVQG